MSVRADLGTLPASCHWPSALAKTSSCAGMSTPITQLRESRRCCPRGQRLWDVTNQLGLSILNTGTHTFIRRAARVVLSAIDVSLATEGCHYTWTPLPDTWGSDHLPILLNPISGQTARSRVCHIVDWKAFRKHCQKEADSTSFLQLVADSGRMATIRSTAQV
ncbi:hypothetical protein MTO96_040295, partial [Rhipicephalus appendiculatus]